MASPTGYSDDFESFSEDASANTSKNVIDDFKETVGYIPPSIVRDHDAVEDAALSQQLDILCMQEKTHGETSRG